MPEPMPLKMELSWKNGKLYNRNKEMRLKLLGLYFCWERHLSDEYLHGLFKYIKQFFNGIRVFGLSTFAKARLEELGVPTWQIFLKNDDDKYDLNSTNSDWLNYIRRFCYIANMHELAVMPVLSDICGFKQSGNDRYGWNTHPFNKHCNINGKYDYTGSQYFKYYRIDRPDKYPGLSQLWEGVVRKVVNATCREGNVIYEIGNELAQEEAHEPYEWLQNFMNHVARWTRLQMESANSPYPAVFANSDEKGHLWGTNNAQIQWAHQMNTTGWNGVSTDGYRIQSVNEFKQKMQAAWNTGKHVEMHMCSMTEVLGVNPEFLMALMWGDNEKVNPYTHWKNHCEKYFEVIKEL